MPAVAESNGGAMVHSRTQMASNRALILCVTPNVDTSNVIRELYLPDSPPQAQNFPSTADISTNSVSWYPYFLQNRYFTCEIDFLVLHDVSYLPTCYNNNVQASILVIDPTMPHVVERTKQSLDSLANIPHTPSRPDLDGASFDAEAQVLLVYAIKPPSTQDIHDELQQLAIDRCAEFEVEPVSSDSTTDPSFGHFDVEGVARVVEAISQHVWGDRDMLHTVGTNMNGSDGTRWNEEDELDDDFDDDVDDDEDDDAYNQYVPLNQEDESYHDIDDIDDDTDVPSTRNNNSTDDYGVVADRMLSIMEMEYERCLAMTRTSTEEQTNDASTTFQLGAPAEDVFNETDNQEINTPPVTAGDTEQRNDSIVQEHSEPETRRPPSPLRQERVNEIRQVMSTIDWPEDAKPSWASDISDENLADLMKRLSADP